MFDSPIPLCPEVCSSDLFCAQALAHESLSLFFLSLYWVLYLETWESGSCLELDKCHFGVFSGPLNHFPSLILRSFLATWASGPDTYGCFQHLCLVSLSCATQPLSWLQALSATEKIIKKLFCDYFNLSPLAPPEFRFELESCPIVIPRGRRGLFMTPEWQDLGSTAHPKAQPGQQCPPLPTVGRLGFSS